jgi:hypothetical protein
MTRPGKVSFIVTLVLASASISGITATTFGGQRAEPNSKILSSSSSPIPTEIAQFAAAVAAKAGDDAPTAVTWVATYRGIANSTIMDANIGSLTADIPVYALEIFGNFSLSWASSVNGEIPHGTVFEAIVDQTTFQMYDYGVVDNAPSMTSLGTPQTQSLEGIRPLKLSAWRAKFDVPFPVRR